MLIDNLKRVLLGKHLYVYRDGMKQYKGEPLRITNVILQGTNNEIVSLEGVVELPGNIRIDVSEHCPLVRIWELMGWQKVSLQDKKTSCITVLVLYP